MKGELELVEFSIPEDLFDKIPMKNKFSKFINFRSQQFKDCYYDAGQFYWGKSF